MRTEGFLVLGDVVSPTLIREAREIFAERYGRYLNGQKHEDALEVGDRRLMITVDLEPPFDRRELLANSWVFSVLSATFEDDFVLGAYGVVCSLPGAPAQHIHQDGGDLFPQTGLNSLLPIVAATVAIPLLEMNDTHGTTALWPGSHRDETRASAGIGDQPLVQEGSCALWDYRLWHRGTPNRSAAPRPLVYMTYCRPWFMDHKNFRKQTPLRASKRFLGELSEDLRRLLVRAQ